MLICFRPAWKARKGTDPRPPAPELTPSLSQHPASSTVCPARLLANPVRPFQTLVNQSPNRIPVNRAFFHSPIRRRSSHSRLEVSFLNALLVSACVTPFLNFSFLCRVAPWATGANRATCCVLRPAARAITSNQSIGTLCRG